MTLNSLVFLCVFLPIVLLLYAAIPSQRIRVAFLVVVSYVFYAYGEPVYVLILFGNTLLNFVAGQMIGALRTKGRLRIAKGVLIGAIVLNLATLALGKYSGMVIESINHYTGLTVPAPAWIIPLGISFYTLLAISYVVDVYRGTIPASKKLSEISLYLAFFPRVTAGPFVRFGDMSSQLAQMRRSRSLQVREIARGLRRFIIGLAKKVLVAGTLGIAVDAIFAAPVGDVRILAAWVAAVAFMIQIYYDFSGYTDMAIGLGHMFGFTIPENFNVPHASTSMQEFWQRWHITLSLWFRDYVYIPLGGNRRGVLRTGINKMIVFLLSGLWHGANWTFVVWGALHGFFVAFEDIVPFKRLPRILQHMYALLIITISFIIFRASSLTQSMYFIQQMFTGFKETAASTSLALSQFSPLFIIVTLVAIIGMLPINRRVRTLFEEHRLSRRFYPALTYGLSIALLVMCVFFLSSGSYFPFIYARF